MSCSCSFNSWFQKSFPAHSFLCVIFFLYTPVPSLSLSSSLLLFLTFLTPVIIVLPLRLFPSPPSQSLVRYPCQSMVRQTSVVEEKTLTSITSASLFMARYMYTCTYTCRHVSDHFVHLWHYATCIQEMFYMKP